MIVERLKEEIRVLRMKREHLLSKRGFENFEKRKSCLRAIQLGLSPDKRGLNNSEKTEMEYLKEYFELLEEYFPELKRKWEASTFWP